MNSNVIPDVHFGYFFLEVLFVKEINPTRIGIDFIIGELFCVR